MSVNWEVKREPIRPEDYEEDSRGFGVLVFFTGAFVGGIWGLLIGYVSAYLAWHK